jgi:diguanylate cyclase (GGDEF)-like protein
MFSKGSLAADFGLKVLLPALSAALAIALLLLNVINGLIAELSSIDQHYSGRAAQSFVTNLQDQLSTVVADNAQWDDSVTNAYGAMNSEWLYTTWGTATAFGVYDSTFVVDKYGETLAAFADGKTTTTPATDQLGNDIINLIHTLSAKPDSFAVQTAIVQRHGTFRVLAIAPILPSTDAVKLPAGDVRFLVLARALDKEFVNKQGMRFGLYDARMAPGAASPGKGLTIFAPGGSVIGHLAWATENAEAAARTKYGQVVWGILASLLFVIGMLVYMSWKGFREAHNAKARAIASSLHDDLTGLPNRRSVIDSLKTHLATRLTPENGLSVVYADLDGFKEVNDSYGHEIGDQLLKAAACGFEFLAAGKGLVSRLGGDEFAVVLHGPGSAANAREVARNMLRFLAEPIVFGGRVANVSVSAGIVDRSEADAGIDAEEFLRRADAAMYAAKSAGRSRVHFYEPKLDSKREQGRAIARELRLALDTSSLGVVYQPIIDARTRRISGVEALVRWPKHAAEHFTPDVFVPVAEEFGLIEDLGYFVMVQACKQAAQWPSIAMSVNVSPIQFMNPAFAETVERILASTGLDPQRLEVEVTEGFIIDNAERAATIIDRLHKLRVSVALDDFGTGYSSIGHLRRFKFDKLKLDRSMVMDILHHPAALRLVQGTIAMADALGLRVTAEGIEDENQVSVLRLAGCSSFQGYLFSKPVDGYQISAMLQGSERAIAV